MKHGLKWMVLIGIAVLPLSAQALLVTCTVAATGVAFANYASPGSTVDNGNGNVAVTCTAMLVTGTASYTIALSAGNSGSFASRTLKSGATNVLNYNMYTNSTLSTVWGDGSAGTQMVSDSYLVLLTPTLRNYTVYGSMPASQNKPAGTYTDTVTVTVSY